MCYKIMFSPPFRLLNKLLKLIRNSIILCSTLVLALFISFQLETAQKFYIDLVNDSLATSKIQIKSGKITGFFPFQFQLSSIEISDQHGLWLKLQNLNLDWNVLALSSLSFELERLKADSLILLRLPEIPKEIQQIDDSNNDIANDHNLNQNLNQNLNYSADAFLVKSIKINKFAITHVSIAKSLIKMNSTPPNLYALKPLNNQPFIKFNLSASSAVNFQDLSTLSLQLSQLDYAPLQETVLNTALKTSATDNNIAIKLTYQYATGMLSLQLETNISEQLLRTIDGQLITLPKQLDISDIKLQLSGDGPVDNWHSQLKLSIKNIAQIESSIQLKKYLSPFFLTPKSIATSSSALTDIVKDNVPELFIDAQGEIVYQQQKFDWQTKFQLLNNKEIKIDKLNILNPIIKLSVNGQLNLDKQSGHLQLDSNIKDLSEISKHPDLALYLHSLMPDLVLLERALSGSNTLHADVRIGEHADNIQIDLLNNVDQLNGFPVEIMNIVGSSPQLNGKINILNKQKIEIEKLYLNSQAINIHIDGNINLENSDVDINLNTQINDLAHFSAAIQQPIKGQLEQLIKIKGSIQKPSINLQLQAQQLVLNNYPLGNLQIQAEIKELLDSPSGYLQIEMDYQQQFLNLSSKFNLKEKVFYLDEFNFSAPQTNILANIKYNLDNNLIDGQLSGQIKQLSKLKFLHQQENLDGDFSFKLTLDKQKDDLHNEDQSIEYSIISKHIHYNQLITKNLSLNGSVSGLQQAISIDSLLAINSIIWQDSSAKKYIGSLSLQAKGHPEKINLDLKVETEDKQSYLNLQSVLVQKMGVQKIGGQQIGQAKNLDITLKSLHGKFLNRPLKLNKETTIHLSGQDSINRISIAPLQLTYANALLNLNADFDKNKDKIAASLSIDALPLSLLSELNLQQAEFEQIVGNANLDVSIQGSIKKPRANLSASIKQLGLDSIANKNIPRLDITLKSKLLSTPSDQKIINRLEISGLTSQPISAKLDLPIELSLQPFNFNWKKNSKTKQYNRLSGGLNGQLDLKKIQNWLKLEEQLIAGQLNVDIKLSGNSDRPQLNGNIEINKASFENAATGTIIKDILIDIKATDKSIQLINLSANDGQQGKIKASGGLDLGIDEDDLIKNYQFKMELDQAQLVNEDEISLQLTGIVNLNGNSKQGKLQSLMTIDQGNFILPKSSSVDIPQLSVIEINKQGEADADKAQTFSADTYPVDLDVLIKIPSKMYVRGRGLESEWNGQVAIKGLISKPLLDGHLEINRGYFNFMSHRFDFRKGVINFVGSIPPQPQLDFELEAKGKEITAILKISGDAEKPDIQLQSEPMLPSDEVLSQLLFNKEMSEISGFEALQLASAVRTLATGGSGFMDKARGAIGVDTLDVNGDDDTGGSVKMGKHISEGVYVEVETGLTSGDSQVKVEMDISDNISVESRVDQQSNTGFGVNWKFDY